LSDSKRGVKKVELKKERKRVANNLAYIRRHVRLLLVEEEGLVSPGMQL